MLLPSENPFKCHEEVLHLQPMIPPKRFDIFPPDWGMLRRSRCVQIFLYKDIVYSTAVQGSSFFLRDASTTDYSIQYSNNIL